MYQIETKEKTYALKARARYYREFKVYLGVQNLRNAFFVAYENVDVDFLAAWIKWFNEDRNLSIDACYDILDAAMDNGKDLETLFAECADFLNGMGFFGKLAFEGESAIAYFSEPMNKLNMDHKMADALDNGMTNVVNRLVEERLMQEKAEAENENKEA